MGPKETDFLEVLLDLCILGCSATAAVVAALEDMGQVVVVALLPLGEEHALCLAAASSSSAAGLLSSWEARRGACCCCPDRVRSQLPKLLLDSSGIPIGVTIAVVCDISFPKFSLAPPAADAEQCCGDINGCCGSIKDTPKRALREDDLDDGAAVVATGDVANMMMIMVALVLRCGVSLSMVVVAVAACVTPKCSVSWGLFAGYCHWIRIVFPKFCSPGCCYYCLSLSSKACVNVSLWKPLKLQPTPACQRHALDGKRDNVNGFVWTRDGANPRARFQHIDNYSVNHTSGIAS